MKRKYLLVGIAVVLAAGGLWLGRTNWQSDGSTPDKSSTDTGIERAQSQRESGQTNNMGARLAPPDQSRKFREFTPEQRVEFARKGHGPGG